MENKTTQLKNLNERILNYTNQHEDLQKSHHWLFDLPPFKDEQLNPEYIVMGINPGESNEKQFPSIVQETRFFDFHESIYVGKREDLNWTKKIFDILRTRKVIQTEMFFWSTNGFSDLMKRFGDFHENEHIKFCTELNKKLIDIHLPKAIICPGLKMAEYIPDLFNLKPVNKIRIENNHRLIEHFRDCQKRDWIVTKHWTGSFGFSKEQKNSIRRYIESLSST